jgi:hypothetical protein
MKIKEEVEAVIIICTINNNNLVAGADIEDSHLFTIIKNTKGRGAEAGIEGGVGSQVTQEDAEVSNTINRQEGILPMKIPMYLLIIHNTKGGEAEVDLRIQGTSAQAEITTTETKNIIMKREEEIFHIISLSSIIVTFTTKITWVITKKIGKDLLQINPYMVSIFIFHLCRRLSNETRRLQLL